MCTFFCWYNGRKQNRLTESKLALWIDHGLKKTSKRILMIWSWKKNSNSSERNFLSTAMNWTPLIALMVTHTFHLVSKVKLAQREKTETFMYVLCLLCAVATIVFQNIHFVQFVWFASGTYFEILLLQHQQKKKSHYTFTNVTAYVRDTDTILIYIRIPIALYCINLSNFSNKKKYHRTGSDDSDSCFVLWLSSHNPSNSTIHYGKGCC